MDAAGLSELVSLWASNTRGDLRPMLPTADESLNRLHQLRRNSLSITKLFKPPSHDVPNELFGQLLKMYPEYALASNDRIYRPTNPCFSQSPYTTRMFTISVTKLNLAKVALASHLASSTLTANNILSAVTWSCICAARSVRLQNHACPLGRAIHQRSKLATMVNGRKQIGLQSADCRPHLGCVCLGALAELDLECLAWLGSSCSPAEDEPAHFNVFVGVVKLIADSISNVNDQFISELLSLAEQTSGVNSLWEGWNLDNGPDLTMSSWANLDIYDAESGPSFGRPDFIRTPNDAAGSLVIVLPRRRRQSISRAEARFVEADSSVGNETDATLPLLGDIDSWSH